MCTGSLISQINHISLKKILRMRYSNPKWFRQNKSRIPLSRNQLIWSRWRQDNSQYRKVWLLKKLLCSRLEGQSLTWEVIQVNSWIASTGYELQPNDQTGQTRNKTLLGNKECKARIWTLDTAPTRGIRKKLCQFTTEYKAIQVTIKVNTQWNFWSRQSKTEKSSHYTSSRLEIYICQLQWLTLWGKKWMLS